MKIYYTPNIQQIKEKAFFDYLIESLPNASHYKEKYELPKELLHKSINTFEIISSIKELNYLSELKKLACLKVLEKLPDEIMVIKSLGDISVDFTLDVNDKIFHIEFHEKQHRVDSNKRLNDIYNLDYEPIQVPRYLQRLLRDIWRWKFLNNYKIVWFDWFENNKDFSAIELISEINQEYALERKFKISDI